MNFNDRDEVVRYLRSLGIPIPDSLREVVAQDAAKGVNPRLKIGREILEKLTLEVKSPEERFEILLNCATYLIVTMMNSPSMVKELGGEAKMMSTIAPYALWNKAVTAANSLFISMIDMAIGKALYDNPELTPQFEAAQQSADNFNQQYLDMLKSVNDRIGKKATEKYHN
jgi:hypothetical protein